METKKITLNVIGNIKTPWHTLQHMPIQPIGAKGIKGVVEVYPEFADGLKEIEGFSHIILIYQLHLVTKPQLEVIPFMDTKSKGVFATRSPKRPNKIGISTVEIEKVEGNKIYILDVDMITNSPLLDIKPFFEDFDNRFNTKKGWLSSKKNIDKFNFKSDDRFI
ncbi:tRNA-Thr(GGU) m(6)t(6)A37 methyltransferase TsaA [Lutibacter profundi]|uniref:tRNA-Thr(GGU) m(6)t(6)A37 methyltransferase TsaA n=1 Tax=Lutibacter profundi TaxID=1622118 RepID=A0A109RN39_9FLAO|nr:tRNA (N6-threonylcarbamoyladenosine(37)-N6)-methyltransferase TrmO [Lutibacter profundi]AMC10405.1 tRNA-Thr(GGU) m(6)t(6)A37 methyltransferase TsaA [Lutibacter profundi]